MTSSPLRMRRSARPPRAFDAEHALPRRMGDPGAAAPPTAGGAAPRLGRAVSDALAEPDLRPALGWARQAGEALGELVVAGAQLAFDDGEVDVGHAPSSHGAGRTPR